MVEVEPAVMHAAEEVYSIIKEWLSLDSPDGHEKLFRDIPYQMKAIFLLFS